MRAMLWITACVGGCVALFSQFSGDTVVIEAWGFFGLIAALLAIAAAVEGRRM